MLEVEHRYFADISKVDTRTYPRYDIKQRYFSFDPIAVRVRVYLENEIEKSANLTMKLGFGVTRTEAEGYLFLNDALELLESPHAKGRLLHKTRYSLPNNWIVDAYHGPLEGIVVAEIETEKEYELPSFVYPIEITENTMGNAEFFCTGPRHAIFAFQAMVKVNDY